MEDLIIKIKQSEGFRGEVYQDHLGFDTLGYGTRMPISKKEAELLLRLRLKDKIRDIETKKPLYNLLPLEAQAIIAEMCYQMGVNGVLRFRMMWAALEDKNYEFAAEEMLESTWAVQTPNRAHDLADKMRAIVPR